MLDPIAAMRRRVAQRRVRPVDPRHSDLYLVEFPKSGVTWLSTLLGNMALIASGREEIANFATSNLYVPDIHVSRRLAEPVHHRPPCRIIKSHAERSADYRFVIYLARRPVPVLKSYYTFARTYQGHTGDFESFVRSDKTGAPAWRRHVRSWMTERPAATRFLLLRYEDLMADAAAQVSRVDEAFGWGIGPQTVAEAVARSSVERMAQSEEAFRDPAREGRFVRSPFAGEMPPGLAERIDADCAAELALLGYDPGA